MNTFFPFFPALVRLISELLSFLNAFMITINVLLDIESVDRYKLPPALFWRLQAHSWDNIAAVLAAGLGNELFENQVMLIISAFLNSRNALLNFRNAVKMRFPESGPNSSHLLPFN
jgi:hypothetical protein